MKKSSFLRYLKSITLCLSFILFSFISNVFAGCSTRCNGWSQKTSSSFDFKYENNCPDVYTGAIGCGDRLEEAWIQKQSIKCVNEKIYRTYQANFFCSGDKCPSWSIMSAGINAKFSSNHTLSTAWSERSSRYYADGVKSDNPCDSCAEWSGTSGACCPMGQNWSSTKNTCICPANSYMSSGSCNACPTGATSSAGSTSKASCSCPTGEVLNIAGTACVPDCKVTGESTADVNECCSGVLRGNNTCGSNLVDGCDIDGYVAGGGGTKGWIDRSRYSVGGVCTVCGPGYTPSDKATLTLADLTNTVPNRSDYYYYRSPNAILSNTECPICPAGSYEAQSEDGNNSHCKKCPPGQYQPEAGKTGCLTCSYGIIGTALSSTVDEFGNGATSCISPNQGWTLSPKELSCYGSKCGNDAFDDSINGPYFKYIGE